MAVDKIILELRAEAKQFKEELAEVRKLVSDIEKKTLKAQENMGGGFNQIAGNLKNLAGTIGVAFGVQQILQFGKATVDAASDLNETQTKVQQLFGSSTQAINEWAGSAAQAFGQSKQQALDAASTFALFGNNAGLAGEDLVDFSTGFTELASDFASFYNTSPEDAINAIGAALRGEAEPIRRYQILLDEASLKQEALRLGLIKTTKDGLTPQNKILATQALIYKQATPAIGDFAKTSDGLANQQRILASQFDNLKTELGKEFLPIVLDVTKAMVNFVKDIDTKDIKDFLNVIKTAGIALATYLTVTKGISLAQKAATLAQAAYKAVTLASAGAQALLTGNTMRAAAAQRALGLATMATPWGLIAGLIAAAASALVIFGDNSSDAADDQNELKKKLDESNKAIEEHRSRLDLINTTWSKYKQNQSELSVEEIRKSIEALNIELENASEVGQREVDLHRTRAYVIDEATGRLVENTNAQTVYTETQEQANKRQSEYIKGLKNQRDALIALLNKKQENISTDNKQVSAFEKLTKQVNDLNKQLLDNITLNKDTYKEERKLLELKEKINKIQFEANALLMERITLTGLAEEVDKEYFKELQKQPKTYKEIAESYRAYSEIAFSESPEERRARFIRDMQDIANASSALASAMGEFGTTLTEVFGKAAQDNAAFAGFLKGITIIEITLAQASAIAQAIAKIAAGDPLSVITGAISLVSSVTALFGGIISQIEGTEIPQAPAFAEGSPYVSLNGNPKGVDTIPAYLNEGEAVIPTDRNKKYPGLASAWINNKLDDYIMSNWVAPAIESERNKSFADNLAEAIKVSGVFDDYRLYRAISEQTSVNKSGFKKLDKVISKSVNPRLRYD